MGALSSVAPVRPDRPEHQRTQRMNGFQPGYRRYIEQLSSCSKPIEDLAEAFPGLLFALCTGYGSQKARSDAFALVQAGAPLKEAAQELGLPYWLKRLPASAFTEPLIALPDTPEFARRVASLIPEEPHGAQQWLWAVHNGYLGCGEDFALWAASWIGKRNRQLSTSNGQDNFRYLAAWAWHSRQPLTPGYDLLRKPWSPKMGLRRALDELVIWRRRIALSAALAGIENSNALKNGTALGYEFVALNTPQDFIQESEAMDNCLDQFGDRLTQTRSRVYSVRRDGRSVANVEIGCHEQEVSMPAILQLRAPRNRRASAEIWQAAYAWLGAQSLRQRHAAGTRNQRLRSQKIARAFWQPYLTHLEQYGLDESFADVIIFGRPRKIPIDSGTARARPMRTQPRQPATAPARP